MHFGTHPVPLTVNAEAPWGPCQQRPPRYTSAASTLSAAARPFPPAW